jgi:hypothetical protein
MGTLLKSIDVIIWDEVPMQHKLAFKCIHCLFIDLCDTNNDVLFSRVPIILKRGLAQTLSIVLRGLQVKMVRVCLWRSFI